ncbi:MAG: hypothetical protein M1441_02415 [Candidatus Parvarchaeota archaeon]|nr:hypothetical protein [Candidatus Parvarchaeota archaeon]
MGVLKDILSRIKGEKTIAVVNDKDSIISITDNGESKSMKLDGWTYSRFDKKKIYTFSYWDYFIPLPSLFKDPNMLMIGLGGGTIIRQLNAIYGPSFKMDAVEISQKVIDLSRKYFGDFPPEVNVINGDGAKFIEDKTAQYNIIILDAYDKIEIPKVFLEQDFINDAYNALKNKGVLAINYALLIKSTIILGSFISRLKKLFGSVYKVSFGMESGNIMILCSKNMDKKEIQSLVGSRFSSVPEAKHILNAYLDMSEK